MSGSTTTEEKTPTPSAKADMPSRRPGLVVRLLQVELLSILVEFVSGVYMVFAGVSTPSVAVHGVFGALAGLVGIVVVVYSYRTPELGVASYCALGFVFVLVAGVAGLLYVRGVPPVAAFSYLMAAGFVLSGVFYSMPLGKINRYRRSTQK